MAEDSSPVKVSFVVTVLNETESLRETVDTIFALAADDVQEVLLVIAPHTTASSRKVIRELTDKYGGAFASTSSGCRFWAGRCRKGSPRSGVSSSC